MNNVIVATIKEWNIKNFFTLKNEYEKKFQLHLIRNKNELNIKNIEIINPDYIFFPHWSWRIPDNIYTNYNCVIFHMTDLPFGRGGSPFQNLIVNKYYHTKISAIKVDGGLDTGDIYLKEDFNISIGSAEENFIKISDIIYKKMIPKFFERKLIPYKQIGKPTSFQRRRPSDSDICLLEKKSLNTLYDFIRMLDAEGYQKAFIDLDNIRIEFNEVHLRNAKLTGRFEIIENE